VCNLWQEEGDGAAASTADGASSTALVTPDSTPQRPVKAANSANGVSSHLQALVQAINNDPLMELDRSSRAVLWHSRKKLARQARDDPEARARFPYVVPKILKSVDSSALNADKLLESVWEARKLILQLADQGDELATETKIMVALELLSGDFSDTVVRAFAVWYLSLIPDSVIARYLQQIVQVRQNRLNKHEICYRGTRQVCDMSCFATGD